MSVIVIKRRAKKAFEVPEGGIILWYGIATDVPDDWAIDAYAKDAFVRGASEGNANNVKVGGTFVHKHTYASKTSAVAAHTHSTTASGTTGSASGSQAHYGTANANAATTNHTHSVSGTRKTDSKGGHDHAMQKTGETEVYPPYCRLYWIKAITDTFLPIGGIVMWDGALAGRPLGTNLCDGTGNTPDLRGNFVYGANQDTDVKKRGGAETHRHANQTVIPDGGHDHSVSGFSTGSGASSKNASTYGGVNLSAGDHSHSLSATLTGDGDHTHTIGDTNAGSSLPPYVMLYFVMRTI